MRQLCPRVICLTDVYARALTKAILGKWQSGDMIAKHKPPKNHTFIAGRQGGVALKITDLDESSVYTASTKCKDTALTKYKL